MGRNLLICFLGCAGVVLSSCKEENPELTAEIAEINEQIAEKEAKLSLLREDIGDRKIDDPSEELAAIQLRSDDLKADVEFAQEDLKQARKEKDRVTAELKAYRKKYPIRDE